MPLDPRRRLASFPAPWARLAHGRCVAALEMLPEQRTGMEELRGRCHLPDARVTVLFEGGSDRSSITDVQARGLQLWHHGHDGGAPVLGRRAGAARQPSQRARGACHAGPRGNTGLCVLEIRLYCIDCSRTTGSD